MVEKHKGPGKANRKGITLIDAVQKFGSEADAEAWFIERRWKDGIRCPHCNSVHISERASRKPMPFHCRTCRQYFSVRTGTVLQASKIPLSKWAIAFYLYSTNLKGVSSMKLHRDLGITQKSAWHMAHRIREAWNVSADKFTGPVEVDETYIGGKESNKHEYKKLRSGRGTVGKTAIAGAKDRATGKVKVAVVERTDRPTLQGFVRYAVEPGTTVYTDEHAAYRGITTFGIDHAAVRHGVGEYVNGQAHTNGIENFWSNLKRGYHGVYHQMSPPFKPTKASYPATIASDTHSPAQIGRAVQPRYVERWLTLTLRTATGRPASIWLNQLHSRPFRSQPLPRNKRPRKWQRAARFAQLRRYWLWCWAGLAYTNSTWAKWVKASCTLYWRFSYSP